MNAIRGAVHKRTKTGADSGFTLVEALVAMVIFVSAMSVMAAVVAAMTTNMSQARGVSTATDQTRLGFQRLDKQVRYANAISTPGPAGGGWYVEFSMENPKRENGNSGQKDVTCQQWRVLAQRLETRSWNIKSNGQVDAPSPWVAVATGVINDLTVEPPFLAPAAGGRLTAAPVVGRIHQGLTVDLHAKRSDRPVGRARLKATFFARNTTGTTSSLGVCDQHGRI